MADREPRMLLKTIRRTDTKLTPAITTRAPRCRHLSQLSHGLTDYGVCAGHLAGRGPADTDSGALAGYFPLIYGSKGWGPNPSERFQVNGSALSLSLLAPSAVSVWFA